MKKFRLTVLILLLTVGFSASAMALGNNNDNDWNNNDWNNGDYDRSYNRHGTQPVGAPLDGGLLALLAAAGVTYFVARKKRKSKSD